MQLLISCAKTMSEAPDIATPRVSVPRFDDTARSLAAHLATLPADELARLLRVNRTLAAENHRRYTLFHDAGVPAAAALAAYGRSTPSAPTGSKGMSSSPAGSRRPSTSGPHG